MSNRREERDQVYAIIRWDGFQGPATRPEALVTVKEIVSSAGASWGRGGSFERAQWRQRRSLLVASDAPDCFGEVGGWPWTVASLRHAADGLRPRL